MSKLKLQKQQISALNDVVNNNLANVSSVNDFIFNNFEIFLINATNLGIDQKTLLNFMKNDKQLSTKLNSFIDNLDIDTFNEYNDFINNLVEKNKLPAYIQKNQENKEIEILVEMKSTLDQFSYIGISFLGNDSYTDIKENVKKLNSFDINKISSESAVDFLTNVFASEGAMEWSIDGPSRVKAATLLEPLYKSPVFIDLVNRELQNNPKLAVKIGEEVSRVINNITEWSLRPINNSGSSSFTVAYQKKLLSICSDVINNGNIPIKESNINHAKDFEDICDRDSSEYGYKKTPKIKYDTVQTHLDNFKNSISFYTPQSKSKKRP